MPYLYPDPIHGLIELPDSLHALSQTRVLARTRNVKQLGLTSVSYPGAVHTRFEHSLGTVAVMQGLLNQFSVNDDEVREAYVRAALLSEIGTLPFSANTATLFKEVNVDKQDMQMMMYRSFLRTDLNLSDDDERILLDASVQRAGWFVTISGLEEFQSLTPVSLASRIDYVLRDGHYSGRYREGFDYRYFRSINPNGDPHAQTELVESIRELHRAIHALNAVYGDLNRRFLTQVLIRLVHRLQNLNAIDLKDLVLPETFVDLDDDAFLARIKSAVERIGGGDGVISAMFSVVAHSEQPHIEHWRVKAEETDLDASQLERVIATKIGLDTDVVFVLAEPHQTNVGFRMFGKDYGSYREAVGSSEFRQLTGLGVVTDKSGLEAGNEVRYFVVK